MIRELKTAILLAGLLCLALPPLTATAAPVWDKSIEFVQAVGRIDWVEGKAVASGLGVAPVNVRDPARRRALARRAAVIDARRNLLEVVGSVRIDSTTKVVNYMVASDVINSSVSGRLTGSVIESERFLNDGSYLVEVSMPIQAALTPEAAKKAVSGQDGYAPHEGENIPAGETDGTRSAPVIERDISEKPAPAAGPLASAPAPDYTGLVIDARGTGFTPSLVPKILGPDGPLYPSAQTAEEVAAGKGFVRYFTDMSRAQQSDRAGAKPLTLKASASDGTSELMLSREDAAMLSRIMSEPDNPLERARVVVVF